MCNTYNGLFCYMYTFKKTSLNSFGGNWVFGKSKKLALVKKEDWKTPKILNVKTEDFKFA